MRLWSISTTVRNPERIRSFLPVLKSIEGEEWNNETQKKFQVLLIQNKVYGFGNPQFHNSLSEIHNEWMNSDNITYKQAEEIVDAKNYTGGGDMRGRQSFNPLEKMGLTYLDENNKIVITSFGDYFLQENYDLGEVFFRSFLKWQYPNPDANKYKKEDGYNIKPFIATLHLISKVNSICSQKGIKVKGVSRHEFALFFVTLSHYKNIEERAKQIIEFRLQFERLKDRNREKKFLEKYFVSKFSDYESWKNAQEYTDNIIRYFRLTRYIYIRGNGWYIDLEPRRSVEINALINSDNASAKIFKTKEDYIRYLGDINQPVLPWENLPKLYEILTTLLSEIISEHEELRKLGLSLPEIPKVNLESKDINELKNQVKALREFRRKLSEKETQFHSRSTDSIENYIEILENIFSISKNRPVELERSISFSLNALNDAIEIRPNYPVGDDNEPTFTAPANKPDIECFYETFNSICEVTLLTNRSQWYNEGQPVMRHIRDFEEIYHDKDTYCLFVAPKLHRDTVNTFWIAVKYEYEGRPQKIIPLSINQFVMLLQILKELKTNDTFLSHLQIKDLYDSILQQTNSVNNSDEWIAKIPEMIENWKLLLVALYGAK